MYVCVYVASLLSVYIRDVYIKGLACVLFGIRRKILGACAFSLVVKFHTSRRASVKKETKKPKGGGNKTK